MKKLIMMVTISLISTINLASAAQSAYDFPQGANTNTGWYDGPAGVSHMSAPTRSANLGLPVVSSSCPTKGSYAAPGNFALRQMGKKTLPPTRLNSFVRQGGEAVFGDEGIGLPPFQSFTEEHRIERAMERNPDLTTGHKMDGPSAWDFPG